MKEEIIELIKPVFNKLQYVKYLEVVESDKADYQINTCFAIAKEYRINPLEVAERIVNELYTLERFNDYFNKVEAINGFINIFISDKLINEYLNKMIGETLPKTDSKIVYFLDYGGPNIAKPLHIGHLRPAIIGESFKRILLSKGYKVISDVHLGDYGLQIGEVIYGILRDNKEVDDIDIEYLNKIYPEISKLCKEDEEVLKECQKITYDFQKGAYKEYFNKIKEVSLTDIKRLYNYLGVDFDLWLGESDAVLYLDILYSKLKENNLIEKDNGEEIVRVKLDTDNKEMPPVKIINKEGAIGYATTDLATILEREEKYHPDYINYFTDSRQSLHFEGVFRVAKLLGVKAKLTHDPFGTINGSDGKPFKTRSGETLKLDELIEMVKENFLSKKEDNKLMNKEDLDKQINAIIKFADLQNNREKSYNFDISKFSEVTGKTGPYVLYSTLRLKKLLESNSECSEIKGTITLDVDRDLRMKLLSFNNIVDKAIRLELPSVIADYTYDLCNLTNSFYQNINISKLDDEMLKNDYVCVLKIAYDVLLKLLYMLGIELPRTM